MKPRVFIGSSTESLSIAYAIQDNLTYDANVTVWSQGIFQLSSTTLDDLLKAVANSDYAVFVFTHDDQAQIRASSISTVRDNIIFELGLFIGRLGKERVFFVIPNGEKDFHLPTDLIGVIPGFYDESREDANMHAALGPFCNQIRIRLKEFVYENLNDLTKESLNAKKIALEKTPCWEFYLYAEMLEQRLIPINQSYQELDNGLIFLKTKICSGIEFKNYYLELSSDLQNLITLLFKLVGEQSIAAFGPPGISGKVLDIKNVADKRLLGKFHLHSRLMILT